MKKVSILRNPSELEVREALTGKRSLRVLLVRDTGTLLAWPLDEGTHADVIAELGLTEETADNLGAIQSLESYQRLVGWVKEH